MKHKSIFISMCALFLLVGNLMAQQDSTLYKVLSEPKHWIDKHVVLRGVVDEYIPVSRPYREGEQRTVEYILRGDFGDRIKVRSHLEAPETNTKYEVTGIFQVSARPQERSDGPVVFEIIETQREIIQRGTTDVIATPATPTPAPSWWDKNGLYVLIIAGAIVLILIIILLVIAFRKPAEKKQSAYNKPLHKEAVAVPKPVEQPQAPSFSSPTEYKTIKLALNPPKTMRFIPGSLEIIGGEDKGKTFKMVGYPTDKGSVVSLGRDSVSGDQAFSHIQLQDQTVSRKQAEIIFRDGKLMLRNLSETNYTQVDGVDVKPNEQVELKSGSVIRTGAIEFKYGL